MEKDTRRLALASVVAGIAAVTLIPVHGGLRSRAAVPLREALLEGSSWFSWFDAIQNTLLFFPLGYLAALGGASGRAWLRAGAAGFAFSAAIECSQSFIPGRYASVWDIAFNGLGAIMGARAAIRYGWPASPPDRAAP